MSISNHRRRNIKKGPVGVSYPHAKKVAFSNACTPTLCEVQDRYKRVNEGANNRHQKRTFLNGRYSWIYVKTKIRKATGTNTYPSAATRLRVSKRIPVACRKFVRNFDKSQIFMRRRKTIKEVIAIAL